MRHTVTFSLLLGIFIPIASAYSPTATEINLGPFPIDNYYSTNNGVLPSCPSTYTIQQCVTYFFNSNPSVQPYSPNNYIAQGVTGVRFQFGVQGGFYSTAWDGSGNVQTQWVNNLRAFLSDLHSYGIVRITPTPALDGWGGPYITPNPPVYDCSGSTPLYFFPWMPFGHLQTNGYPDCQDNNNGYNIANGNPYFWGWTPFFNLMNQIFSAISASGLQLGELDINNEIDVVDFTVQARLIYDNVRGTDVIGTLRSYASDYGFNPGVVTFSVPSVQPSAAGYHCGSVYGDSALILQESDLTGAYAGGGSVFGLPSDGTVINDLLCGGNTTGMISLPVGYSQPQLTDIHIYPCVFSPSLGYCDPNQDTTSTATVIYSDTWSFLVYRGLTGNRMMVGETQSQQNCDNYTSAMAGQNINGYLASTLYNNDAGSVTMRPWNNDASSCYVTPSVINPPYNSFN